MVARLAETYLMLAEASFRLGECGRGGECDQRGEKTRRLPGQEAAMEITADQVSLDFILDERSRELLGEMHRWFDLKRTDTLIDRVQKVQSRRGAPTSRTPPAQTQFLPTSLDRVTNKDEFKQNPGTDPGHRTKKPAAYQGLFCCKAAGKNFVQNRLCLPFCLL
jgi:hypothetical protein